MKTLVTGSSGLVGSALVEFLFKKGYSIQCLRRNTGKEHTHFWVTQSPGLDDECKYKAVIHLAGENVANGRWTSTKKKRILKVGLRQATVLPGRFLIRGRLKISGRLITWNR